MIRAFAEARRAVAGRPIALVRLWGRAVGDAVWHGLLERLGVRREVTLSRRAIGSSLTDAGPGRRAGFGILRGIATDVRLGVRRLAGAPSFTLVAAVTLALGIGANSAIFSVVHGVLLKPLPFREPDRLVGLFQVWEGRRSVFAPPNLLDVQARAKTLAYAAGYDDHRFTLTRAGEPAAIVGAEVTRGFFETLAAPAALGRTFRPEEHEPGRTAVVVLGDSIWRQRFAADPLIVGRPVVLDGISHEVVGVMPAHLRWPLAAEFWVPVEYDEVFLTKNRGAWYLGAIARLAPGVSLQQAAAEMQTIAGQLEREHPQVNTAVGITVHPLLDSLVGDTRRALLVLLAAVGVVLLIACANVANLLLARASAREDEIAVRVALGARRRDLVRQILVESLLLGAIGGGAGLAVAVGGVRALAAMRPDGIPRLSDINVDVTVVAFTCAAAMLTALVFGLVPALEISRRSLAGTLQERGRSGTGSRRGNRLRNGLVVIETALAVVLLAGAGLLIRSFVQLSRVDPGFVVSDAATFSLRLPDAAYDADSKRLSFYERLRASLASQPGVTAVGSVLTIPPGGSDLNLSFEIAGRPPYPPGQEPVLEVRVADGAYFTTMGIPLRRGRLFTDADRLGSTPVLLITESAVRAHFANDDPIGKQITLGWRRNQVRVGGTVVGVVGDVKTFGLDAEAPPQVYVALDQVPVGSMAFVVRTAGDPTAAFGAIRRSVAELDSSLPLNRLQTLRQLVDQTVAEERFLMLLLSMFASVALLLAAVGTFGVLSCLVAQRTREIGVRVALGARPGAVLALVMRRAILLSGTGAAIGAMAAMAGMRTLQALLFEVDATDPLTILTAACSLFCVAMFAAWIPARRATAVDPLVTLRAD